MLRISTRFSLARMIDKWRKENELSICPETTIAYLMLHGLLLDNEDYRFGSRELSIKYLVRYGMLIDRWQKENGIANDPASTLRYLLNKGHLDVPAIREFVSELFEEE